MVAYRGAINLDPDQVPTKVISISNSTTYRNPSEQLGLVDVYG